MYQPLTRHDITCLKKTTKFSLYTAEASGLREQVYIPYTFKAMIKDNITWVDEDWPLYNLHLTITPALLKAEDIKYTKFMMNILSDGLPDDIGYAIYFFENFLDSLRKLADMTKSARILVATTLPYAPEVMVDKEYKIRAREHSDPIVYRGMWSRVLEKLDKFFKEN